MDLGFGFSCSIWSGFGIMLNYDWLLIIIVCICSKRFLQTIDNNSTFATPQKVTLNNRVLIKLYKPEALASYGACIEQCPHGKKNSDRYGLVYHTSIHNLILYIYTYISIYRHVPLVCKVGQCLLIKHNQPTNRTSGEMFDFCKLPNH